MTTDDPRIAALADILMDAMYAKGYQNPKLFAEEIIKRLPPDWCGHEAVIEAYKQAIRDLGSSPEAQANIAVTLMQQEIARLREALTDLIESAPGEGRHYSLIRARAALEDPR